MPTTRPEPPPCTNPQGHDFRCAGTPPPWYDGEGRDCLCAHCGLIPSPVVAPSRLYYCATCDAITTTPPWCSDSCRANYRPPLHVQSRITHAQRSGLLPSLPTRAQVASAIGGDAQQVSAVLDYLTRTA